MGPLWRIDGEPWSRWGWAAPPEPRFRFDSALGSARVRYAATAAHGSARERYRDSGNYIPPDHGDHYLVRLDGTLAVLDLRRQSTLDGLGLDDRVSTSHESSVLDDAHTLCDRVLAWWGRDIHGICYRSRTTPSTSANVAFFAHAPLQGRSRRLRSSPGFLDELIVAWGFTIDL